MQCPNCLQSHEKTYVGFSTIECYNERCRSSVVPKAIAGMQSYPEDTLELTVLKSRRQPWGVVCIPEHIQSKFDFHSRTVAILESEPFKYALTTRVFLLSPDKRDQYLGLSLTQRYLRNTPDRKLRDRQLMQEYVPVAVDLLGYEDGHFSKDSREVYEALFSLPYAKRPWA